MQLRPLYVVGGQQPHRAGADWCEYDKGIILEVDPESGDARRVAEYVSLPGTYAPSSAQITFKSAWLCDGLLYCTTMTEILIFQVPDFRKPVHYISLPCFNDLHCVRPVPGGQNLVVANSGLDNCIELTPEGEVVRIDPMLDGSLPDRLEAGRDYRLVSTKPHLSHPNHLFYVNGELWVTRFVQRDAVSLADRSRRIDVALERTHDGVVYESAIYFTTVDGKIVLADPDSLAVTKVVDLTEFDEHGSGILGWARGMWHAGPDLIWIGLTRMKRITPAMRRMPNGLAPHRPTRIALYDLTGRRVVTEINLEPAGLDSVYSVVPVPAGQPETGREAETP